MSEAAVAPGRRMTEEIAEQPSVFSDLLATRPAIAQVAAQIAQRRPRFVLLAARGSSDHAALYAKYLVEITLGLPAGLVSPSTTTLYGAKQRLDDVLLITVSQSGGSPDLVEVTRHARENGATTVAVTNTSDSPLNSTAELSVDVRAGREQAVAATKSYSATLLALYLLIDGINGGTGADADPIPELASKALTDSRDAVDAVVGRYRFASRMITVGRGYSYATATEAALKLAETSYLHVRAFSGADLLHGPVAAVDEDTAVVALCGAGKGGEAMHDVLATVRERGADICAVGSAAHEAQAAHHIDVPACPEELAPVLEVLPLQQLALRLALARGENPDSPRGLNKVTKTR